MAKPSDSKKAASTPTSKRDLLFADIRKLVWAFADLVRDKGNGTTEDYAKVVIPTCQVKRTLDLQTEWVATNAAAEFEALAIGVEPHQILQDINQKSFRFYNGAVTSNPEKASIVLLGWEHLVAFQDNPNGAVVRITLPFEQFYETRARNFVELMFEVIDSFNSAIAYVFESFEFKSLLVQKTILPYADYYKTCHEELSTYAFNMANVSTDMFSNIYMELIGRFASDSGKKGGEFFTPTALVRSAWRFLDIDSYARKLASGEKTSISIGDPTSGSNTFLIYGYDLISQACADLGLGPVAKEAFRFYGQELKGFQYCLGLVNMMFHNVIDQYNQDIGDHRSQNANVITEYYGGIGKMRGKLDIIVANPPYGTKDYGIEYAQSHQTTEPRWKYGIPNKSEGEFAFLFTILDLLNRQGKSVVILPLGTLFRGAAARFRQAFLEEDVLEGLITLPANMFQTTSIPVVLWVFNKNKAPADKGKVFMVNASQDFEKAGKFNEWHADKALRAYLGRIEVADYSGYVDTVKLEQNQCNFSVQRYFSPAIEGGALDLRALNDEIERLTQAVQVGQHEINALVSQAVTILSVEGDVGTC